MAEQQRMASEALAASTTMAAAAISEAEASNEQLQVRMAHTAKIRARLCRAADFSPGAFPQAPLPGECTVGWVGYS